MSPKEKALELCQKFGYTTIFAEDCNDGMSLPLRISKKCALIAANEIIKEYGTYFKINVDDKYVSYWEEVKQEIEKL